MSDGALKMRVLHGDYPSHTIMAPNGPPSWQMEILWGFALKFFAGKKAYPQHPRLETLSAPCTFISYSINIYGLWCSFHVQSILVCSRQSAGFVVDVIKPNLVADWRLIPQIIYIQMLIWVFNISRMKKKNCLFIPHASRLTKCLKFKEIG